MRIVRRRMGGNVNLYDVHKIVLNSAVGSPYFTVVKREWEFGKDGNK